MMDRRRLFAAMDLGTTKVKVVVAAVGSNGLEVVGAAQSPSQGVQGGRIVRVEEAAAAVEAAISEAEVSCSGEIKRVLLALPGGFIRGVNRSGMVPVTCEVKPGDIGEVRDVAIAMRLAPDQDLLEAVPQCYTVDETAGVDDPSGMFATRLDANFHVVVVASSAVKNLCKCCELQDLIISDLSLPQLASAEAVLEEDEKELGVCLVDIGGGSTDIAVYRDGMLIHTAVFGIGGNDMTTQLANGLMTPRNEAERLKIKYGCAHPCRVDPEETFEVSGLGGRPARILPKMDMVNLLGPIVEDIMMKIVREMHGVCALEDLAAGIVFTGGVSELPGLLEVAEDVTRIAVRKGVPKGVGNACRWVANGAFSTAIGLVLRATKGNNSTLYRGTRERRGVVSALSKGFERTKEFFM